MQKPYGSYPKTGQPCQCNDVSLFPLRPRSACPTVVSTLMVVVIGPTLEFISFFACALEKRASPSACPQLALAGGSVLLHDKMNISMATQTPILCIQVSGEVCALSNEHIMRTRKKRAVHASIPHQCCNMCEATPDTIVLRVVC